MAIGSRANGVLNIMLLGKLNKAANLVLTFSLLAAGTAGVVHDCSAEEPSQEDREAKAKQQPADQKSVRLDLYGSPLPQGALARMGSSALRHENAEVAFSRDGKMLISLGRDRTVRQWDVTTGQLVRHRRIAPRETAADRQFAMTLSPNGELFAVAEKDSVSICDTATAAPRVQFAVKGAPNSRRVFDPSGETLAVFSRQANAYADAHLWDTKTGKERAALELDHPINLWATTFSPDGKLLAILDPPGGNSTLLVWDTVTGKKLRQVVEQGMHIALAISSDGKLLATGGHQDVVLREMETLKEISRMSLPSPEGVSTLSFSPDGSLLGGARQHADIILWDVKERKEKCRLGALRTDRLVFSQDNKIIAAWGGSGDEIQLWDVGTSKRIHEKSGHGHYVDAVAVSADGKLVASGALHDPVLRLWDAATGKPLHQIRTADDWVTTCAISADGQIAVSGGHNGTIQIWATNTGKELHRFVFENPPNFRGGRMMMVAQVHLSPDGRRLTAFCVNLLIKESTAELRVWDTSTEKLLTDRPFRIDAHFGPNPGGGSRGMWRAHSRFSPDGTVVTVRTKEGLTFEDTATGRETVTVAGNLGRPLALSLDGRLAAISEFEPFDDPFHGYKSRAVVLAEVLTGKEVMRLETGQIRHLDFSPDGRFLATADATSLRLWDTATGQPVFRRDWPNEIRTLPEHCPALSFAFALDGCAIVTGLHDGTLLVWDVGADRRPSALGGEPVDRKQFDLLWADLAGADVRKAYRATHLLALAQAIPFLKECLHAVGPADAKHVEKLIADLDSEQFAAREAAAEGLAKIVDLAVPLLRRAQETSPSAEVKRRIAKLLAMPDPIPSGDRLRTLRAIAVLERIGSPEALDVLRNLATGVPSARETREAKQALERRIGQQDRQKRHDR
jgi:WD40 repeat protein